MINTATIYLTQEELTAYKRRASEENRREAAQLVYLARRASENPQQFRLIKRPDNVKPYYQVKTRDANPYLETLAAAIGGPSITFSDIVESLIRGLSQ